MKRPERLAAAAFAQRSQSEEGRSGVSSGRAACQVEIAAVLGVASHISITCSARQLLLGGIRRRFLPPPPQRPKFQDVAREMQGRVCAVLCGVWDLVPKCCLWNVLKNRPIQQPRLLVEADLGFVSIARSQRIPELPTCPFQGSSAPSRTDLLFTPGAAALQTNSTSGFDSRLFALIQADGTGCVWAGGGRSQALS